MIGVARKPSEAFAQAAAESGDAGALHFEPFDLTDVAAIPAFVRGLKDRLRADLWPCQQRRRRNGRVAGDMRNADIEALLRLNTLAPIMLTKYVVRGMMAEGRGRIVNIASIVASTGYNGLSVYFGEQGGARRLHARAGPRGRQGRRHRQRDRAGFRRHRVDPRSRRRAARPYRRPQRATAAGRGGRRRGDGGAADGRGRPQRYRPLLTVDAGATA